MSKKNPLAPLRKVRTEKLRARVDARSLSPLELRLVSGGVATQADLAGRAGPALRADPVPGARANPVPGLRANPVNGKRT